MLKVSEVTRNLKQSDIRNASARCNQIGGINLGQGICDLPIIELLKSSAIKAINGDKNIYSPCEGIYELREAIAKKLNSFNNIEVDPASEIIVTHGSTGAFVCAVMTLFNPGDEVILFEPFYGYHKNILKLNRVEVKTVPINLHDLTFDPADLAKTISAKTKGIVICTPCNPCGKVFSRSELQAIGEFADKYNLVVLSDEIYEYITYPGYEHVSPASLPILSSRTITLSGFSKTYNMTGWRLGYAAGPDHILSKMALVQDLLYVCPVTPLQYAVISAFDLPESYYRDLRETYFHKSNYVTHELENMGFKPVVPQGAYYLMVDFSGLGFVDDKEAAEVILNNAKVATVPGGSFYLNPIQGAKYIRICYALNEHKINLAMEQIKFALTG